ncbi:hypothetical protein [Mangrovicoccus ximenensis]|uniref:hypothetical protein n=1 Tax=Mangrovicoccus ximenensis TaxID=1911570 RepID=UPI0013753910|nr:hypothetical protein [Mangrovicoccus ximenensis]
MTVAPPGVPGDAEPETVLTEEASFLASLSEDLRVEPLAAEGAVLAQGAPLLRLRKPAGVVLTAPMAGRITVRVGTRSASIPIAMPPSASPAIPAVLMKAMPPRLQPSARSSGSKKADSPLTSCPMAMASMAAAAAAIAQRREEVSAGMSLSPHAAGRRGCSQAGRKA